MVDYSNFAAPDETDFGSGLASATPGQIAEGARTVQPGNYSMGTTILGDAALGVVDLADVVTSSTIGRVGGPGRGKVNAAAMSIFGPGVGKFMMENKGGIEAVSGIAGVIVAELATRKLLAVARPAVEVIKSVPYARRLLTMEAQSERALASVRAVDSIIAQKGITGARQFTEAALVPVSSMSRAGEWSTSMQLVGRNVVANQARRTAMFGGALRAGATEVTIAATQNTNDFLFPTMGAAMFNAGLGVAAGGIFGRVAANYAMKKFANTDVLTRFRAEAIDSTGIARRMLEPLDAGSPRQAEFFGNLQGTKTDVATAYMTEAKAIRPEKTDPTTWSTLTTAREAQAKAVMEEVTQKGIMGLEGTRFTMEGTAHGKAIQSGWKGDEGAVFGWEMAGAVGDDGIMATHFLKDDLVKGRINTVGNQLEQQQKQYLEIQAKQGAGVKLKKNEQKFLDEYGQRNAELRSEMKQLRYNDGLTPSVFVDGENLPLSHGQMLDNWIEPVVLRRDDLGAPVFEAHEPLGRTPLGISIDANLNIIIGKGAGGKKGLPRFGKPKTADPLATKTSRPGLNMDHYDYLRLYRATDKAADHVVGEMVKNPTFQLVLPQNPSWFQLDAAEEIAKRAEAKGTTPQIYWGKGITRESAQVKSLAEKADILAAKKFADITDPAELAKLRVQFNLPRLTAYQMGLLNTQAHPIDIVLKGAHALGGGKTLNDMSLQEVKQTLIKAQSLSDLTAMNPSEIKSLAGNSFNYMKSIDANGKAEFVPPVLTYKRALKAHDWSREDLADRIAARKFQQHATLTNPGAGPLTRDLTNALTANPDTALAGEVNALADIQLAMNAPLLENAAPTSATGAIATSLNPFATTEFRARDSKVLLAVTRTREAIDRYTRQYMKEEMESVMGDTLSVLNGPRNVQSKLLLDQFHTPGISSGWDLEAKVKSMPAKDGNGNVHAFLLSDTQHNRARWQEQFPNEPFQPGVTLKGPNGVEVVLDDLALDAQQKLNVLTDRQRIEKNSILRANGLPEIRRTEWYVPPPSVEGKYISYTFDVNGNIVRGGTVIADTEAKMAAEIARVKANPDSVMNRVGNVVRGRKEIEAYGSLWERRQMDMVDANTTAMQGGRVNKGSLASGVVRQGSLDQSLRAIRDNYLNHGSDLLETMFKDQIIAVEQARQVAIGETKSRAGFWQDVNFKSSHDLWLQELRGRSPLSSNSSPIAALYNPIENFVNRVLEEQAPRASEVFHAVTDWATKRMPWGSTVQDKKMFDGLSEKLGQHMPFKDAHEMIAARDAGAKAWTLSEITGTGNKFAASWMLRMFEVAHPIMNLTGIVNAMPAVIRQYQRQSWETAEEFANRVGHSVTIFGQTGSDVTHSAVDMGKVAKRAFMASWKGDPRFAQYTDDALRQGMLGQEVDIFNRQFREFEKPKGVVGRHAEKMTNWMSVLSDKSEDFSRNWAHHVGIDMALTMGMTDKRIVNNFAHDIANKMIANYSPRNRAELFQGAVGAPIGLFQSFMVAYWQRMFRYVETKQYRNLAVQMAMQGGLFGGKTIPGFAQVNDWMFSNSDGTSDFEDQLVHRFGADASDLLMAGSMSNLPKLWNILPGEQGIDGVNLYDRGDPSPRLPVIGGVPPALSVIGKIKQGVADAAAMLSDRNPKITTQQMGEIISNTLANRPMAGMVEQFLAGGKDTDSYGQLVSENLTWMESIYRMTGLRSLRQSAELEAFYKNKQMNETKAAQQEVLREGSRSAIRSGDPDALPAIFETYILNGGDERDFRRWYLDNYEAATETRGSRQLDDMMKDQSKMAGVQRLIDAQVGFAEDDETPDPMELYSTGADPMDDPNMPLNDESDPGYAYDSGYTQNVNPAAPQ